MEDHRLEQSEAAACPQQPAWQSSSQASSGGSANSSGMMDSAQPPKVQASTPRKNALEERPGAACPGAGFAVSQVRKGWTKPGRRAAMRARGSGRGAVETSGGSAVVG